VPQIAIARAHAASHSFLLDCVIFASSALLFYDHVITFADEVRLVWLRMSCKGSWLFLANRYLAFFTFIAIAVFNRIQVSEADCKIFSPVRQGLLVLSVLIIACE
jgi:hypothetical protein